MNVPPNKTVFRIINSRLAVQQGLRGVYVFIPSYTSVRQTILSGCDCFLASIFLSCKSFVYFCAEKKRRDHWREELPFSPAVKSL